MDSNKDTKEHRFFTNREIWEQVFGKDGRGGAIGELHQKVDDKFNKLENMICIEFKEAKTNLEALSQQLKEYNGLHEKIDEVENNVKEHIDDWENFTVNINTQEAVDKALKEEHFKGMEEADRSFKKRVKSVSIYISIASIIIGSTIAVIKMIFF